MAQNNKWEGVCHKTTPTYIIGTGIIMSIHEPSRGGNRGGKDNFTWDGVKVDKHRENYLGM